MPRRSDNDTILSLLINSNESLSIPRLREALGWNEEKFKRTLTEVIEKKLAEKFRCRGGGVRLTESGYTSSERLKRIRSSVSEEKELYPSLIDLLHSDARFTDDASKTFDISGMRELGLWRNPDIIMIAINKYTILEKKDIHVTSYEVKKADSWNINSIFESASHSRYVHESYFVLEREKDSVIGLEDAIDVCRHFGVGLMIMFKDGDAFHKKIILEADTKQPKDDNLENFLAGVFQYKPDIGKWFKDRFRI